MASGTGDDVLTGGSTSSRYANLLEGGAGDDIYTINSKLDHVIEGANAGVDEVRASIDFVLGSNVEDLRLMDGAVSGAANDLANVIRGNDEHNVLKAMGGDELVYGGACNDDIAGGWIGRAEGREGVCLYV